MSQNYTQKSLDAIRVAQSIATDHGHVQLEPVHNFIRVAYPR